MSDQMETPSSPTHHQHHPDAMVAADQGSPEETIVDASDNHDDQRTPGDGDSPVPTPPPRPTTTKKWVRFDESAPASMDESTIIGGGQQSQSENGSTTADDGIAGRLPKPAVAPRRSTPAANGHSSMDNDGGGIINNIGADVAQINVSVEEAKRPQKSTTVTNPTSILHQRATNNESPSGTSSTRETSVGSNGRTYENGKIITEKKSENKHCAWVTIARFDPYKMPKSLISDQLTMPVEDYVTAMEMLTNDFRFRSYTVLYRRLIAGWLVASLFILIIILLSGLHGASLFGMTIFWLLLTCFGVVACLCIKKRINKGLHNCVASVNKLLLRYNLLVGLEDRGRMSCHKIIIPFVYMDPKDCIPKIKHMLAQQAETSANGTTGSNAVSSVSVDVEATSANSRPATAEERAEELILKFSQSYVRAAVRRTIKFPSRPSEGVRDEQPLHCTNSLCLCQYLRKYYFERTPKKWYHRFCLDSDLPSHERATFSQTVVAYGYPPVVYG